MSAQVTTTLKTSWTHPWAPSLGAWCLRALLAVRMIGGEDEDFTITGSPSDAEDADFDRQAWNGAQTASLSQRWRAGHAKSRLTSVGEP